MPRGVVPAGDARRFTGGDGAIPARLEYLLGRRHPWNPRKPPMTRSAAHQPDPVLDLVLERVVDVPRHLVWDAWTRPELLKQWFTPAPWQTVDCKIELRPGGAFCTTMRGPEGPEFVNTGCFLEVVPDEKLVWTGALGPGFRPRPAAELANFPFVMTAIITMAAVGAGTKYNATVIHGDAESCQKHAQMGFHQGWSVALDQLVALARTWM